jgi:hypothetical protein
MTNLSRLLKSIKKLSEEYNFPYEEACNELGLSTKRKSCEHNYLEAAFAASLLSPIRSKEDINTNLKNNQIIMDSDRERQGYIQEITNTTKKILYDDINNATKPFRDNITPASKIFLTGKKIKNETINSLTLPLTKKENKADIFATHDEQYWKGYSIKETNNCTLSNWPLDKIEKETNNTSVLKETRCKWLTEKSNIHRGWNNGLTDEQKKEVRKTYNDMFRQENPYKNAIDTFITSMSNNDIKKYLAMAYGSSVHNKVSNLEMIQYTPSCGLEKLSYIYDNIMSNNNIVVIKDDGTINMMDKYNIRTYYSDNAAKMWHYFMIDGKIKYRSEIRWKGNCWDSMQWFFHKI